MAGDVIRWRVVALFALGIGWNFGFIGATAMLAERVAPADRASGGIS